MNFRPRTIALVVLGLLAGVGCLHPPLFWSPDGAWLAYTIGKRSPRQALKPGWLFETVHSQTLSGAAAESKPERGKTSGLKYQIWASKAADEVSVLLEESSGPLTSPVWKPDGTALAFGKIVNETQGGGRFEIVVQDGPRHQRVISSEPFPTGELGAEATDLPDLSIAWSPDGRWLAVPRVNPRGLAILKADNGRVVKTIDDSYLPAWSPDSRVLAYVHAGESDSLFCLTIAPLGAPRPMIDLGASASSIAPVWTRDGKAILAVRSGPGGRFSNDVELVQVSLDTLRVDVVRRLIASRPSGAGDEQVLSYSYASSRDADEFFSVSVVEGQETSIVRSFPRRSKDKAFEEEIHSRFHPVDAVVPIGSISLSPTERKLALRMGPAGFLAPPAIFDLASAHLQPLLPDDHARVEWIAIAVNAARKVLALGAPAAEKSRETASPTILPPPGEAFLDSSFAPRIKTIANFGMSLCERPAGLVRPEPEVQAVLDEALLFFSYLNEDFKRSRAALEAVEAKARTADERLRMLGLRAQIALGLREFDRARSIIDFIASTQPRRVQRVEDSPDGRSVSELVTPTQLWIRSLRKRIDDEEQEQSKRTKTRGAVFMDGPAPDDVPNFRIEEPAGPQRFFLQLDEDVPGARKKQAVVEQPKKRVNAVKSQRAIQEQQRIDAARRAILEKGRAKGSGPNRGTSRKGE